MSFKNSGFWKGVNGHYQTPVSRFVELNFLANGTVYTIDSNEDEQRRLDEIPRDILPLAYADGHVAYDLDKCSLPVSLRIETVRRQNHKSSCVFNATDKYVQAIVGGRLDDSDREWFRSRAVVQHAGVPLHEAIQVVHHLVRPYGLGVSRVLIPSGTAYEFDPAVVAALGVNPIAAIDSSTSNETARASGLQGNWLMDYVSDFTGPAIVFAGMHHEVIASGGGHTEFKSPRAALTRDWDLAIQVNRLDNIQYNGPWPSEPDREADNTDKVLSLTGTSIGGVNLFNILSRGWPQPVASTKPVTLAKHDAEHDEDCHWVEPIDFALRYSHELIKTPEEAIAVVPIPDGGRGFQADSFRHSLHTYDFGPALFLLAQSQGAPYLVPKAHGRMLSMTADKQLVLHRELFLAFTAVLAAVYSLDNIYYKSLDELLGVMVKWDWAAVLDEAERKSNLLLPAVEWAVSTLTGEPKAGVEAVQILKGLTVNEPAFIY